MRVVWQRDPRAPAHMLFIDVDFAGQFRQRLIQRGGQCRAGQGAEIRNHAAGAAGVLAARQHAFDMHGESVAGFGSLDHDRTVLRIDERHAQPFGRLVAFRADGALEGVAGFDADAIARRNGQHGIGVGADRVMEFSLYRLRQVVQRWLFRPTQAAARDDRLGGPLWLCRTRHLRMPPLFVCYDGTFPLCCGVSPRYAAERQCVLGQCVLGQAARYRWTPSLPVSRTSSPRPNM